METITHGITTTVESLDSHTTLMHSVIINVNGMETITHCITTTVESLDNHTTCVTTMVESLDNHTTLMHSDTTTLIRRDEIA
jgi:hypothetical protein